MEQVADLLYGLPQSFGLLFDVVHYVLCLQAERADLGDRFNDVTKKNPLGSWASAMAVCFGGGLLVNLICGEPMLEAIDDPLRLGLATLLWYLMFYSPQDAVYSTSKLTPVRIPLYLIKGLYYPKKIAAGIKHARHVFGKQTMVAALLVATVKANGSGFAKPLARLLRGSTGDIGMCLETVKPSLVTKYCFFCALLYCLLPFDATYVAICGILVAMKAGPLFSLPVDVFSAVEDKVGVAMFKGRQVEEKKD